MPHRLPTRTGPQRKLAADSLQRCPLCGAISSRLSQECFVCTWRGEFDHDPARIEQGVSELLERCPELAEAILEQPAPRPMSLMRFRNRLSRMFRRRIDFAV